MSEDVKAKLSKIFKGRVFTDEWKRKISNAKKGVSPIYKNGNPRLGKPSPSRRRVDVFNRDLIYYETCDCIKDAAQKYGVDTGAVVRVASGQRNHANGYVFRYAD